MASINELKTHFAQPGKIEWIGLRTAKSREILSVNTAELQQGHGLIGDKAGQRPGGKRQVTLIQAEYLPVMASFMNQTETLPEIFRRNIVVSKINLSVLLKHTLRINDVIIEITGNCAPCKKMEESMGFGAFNAMRNHGGVNAMVKVGGVISIGDEVEVCLEPDEDSSQTSRQVQLL